MSDEEIKVEVYKTEDGKNCLVLASVYKNNCSQETTVIIEDDVLEVLEAARRENERQRSRKRRHGLKKIYLEMCIRDSSKSCCCRLYTAAGYSM